MTRITLTFAVCTVLLTGSVRAGSEAPTQPRVPVLVELFTSEGCSSCPPADSLLETLDKQQSVAGANLIVISEHVDYWNHLGWSDPFSSPFYSARQHEYSNRLGTDEVYTPQLIVDGRAELVGSDKPKALNAIQRAAKQPKVALTVRASRGGTVHVDAPVQESNSSKLDLYVVLAADRMRSQVARGENAGRSLTHVAVAYSFSKSGSWNATDALNRDLHVNVKAGDTRVIVFLQDPHSGRIAGVAQIKI